MSIAPPRSFSARNRRDNSQIVGDFPASARTGLLHVLNEAVERDYLISWSVAAQELARIARDAPINYDERSIDSIRAAKSYVVMQLNHLRWNLLYDFCERLHTHLARDVSLSYNYEVSIVTKGQARAFFEEELQRLFEEENIGYEFHQGLIQRRGNRHTMTQANKAEKFLDDQKLESARRHFSKALGYFHDRKKTDHENCVKEAICAVEAAAKELFPDARAKTLGDFITWATDGERKLLPKTIGQTFSGLYGFRNSGEGVAHGGASGGAVTAELSEYVLGAAASQIVFLADLAKKDKHRPS